MKNMRTILNSILIASIFMGVQLFGYSPDAFVIKIRTGGHSGFEYHIHTDPKYQYDYNVTIDGDVYSSITGDFNLSFPVEKIYHIIITGKFPAINYPDQNTVEIEQWGMGKWKSMENAFRGASGLIVTAPDNPDLSEVENMSYMFHGAEELTFTHSINDWNVSKVTDMSYLFNAAKNFNQDIGNWNVSNVTNMHAMFYLASSFNQDIGDWNTAKVDDIAYIFSRATAFNQDISQWNLQSITDTNKFIDMFSEISLSIGNYDTLLTEWSKRNLVHNVEFDAGLSKYCKGEAAKAHMMDAAVLNWTIVDEGKNCDFYIITPNEVTVKSGETAVFMNIDANVDEGEDAYHYIVENIADWDKFEINLYGELKFKLAPNVNNPTDKNSDNIYRVQVKTTHPGYASDYQTIKVTVEPDNNGALVPVISYILF